MSVGLVTLLVVTGSLVLAQPAYAIGTPMQVSETTEISSEPTRTLTVACPRGTQVVSGGARVGQQLSHVRVVNLQPDTTGGAWFRADALAESRFAGEWSLTVYAICAAAPRGGFDYSTFAARNLPDERQSLRPYCQGTKKLVGFGGRVATADNPREVALTAVMPDADLTNVLVIGEETGAGEPDDWGLTAYTVCADTDAEIRYDVDWGEPNSTTPQANLASCFNQGLQLLAMGFTIYAGFGHVVLHNLDPYSPSTAEMSATEESAGFDQGWYSAIQILCI
jgi:hypothetical protein